MSEINDKVHVVKRVHADSQLPVYSTAGAAAADVVAHLIAGTRLKKYDPDNKESEVAVECFHANGGSMSITYISIAPGERVLIPTGIMIIPGEGYELQVRPRSGFPLKTGLLITNAPGTVDEDYRGEIAVGLVNVGSHTARIRHGERIAQVVLSPVVRLFGDPSQETLIMGPNDDIASARTSTDRGTGGFGSTGK